MKKYEQVRSKIKLYINHLKENYSTNEFKEYDPEMMCKEFGVSFTLPILLKRNGYLEHECKNYVNKLRLTNNFLTLDEVIAHNLCLDYSKAAYKKKQLLFKKLKLKEEKKAQKQEIIQKRVDSKNHYKELGRKYKKKIGGATKTISIRLPYSIYQDILIECEKTNTNVTNYFNQLIKDSGVEDNYPPKQKSIEEIKDTLLKDPNFKGIFKKQVELPLLKVGRPKKEKPEPMWKKRLKDTLHQEPMKTLDEYNQSKRNPQVSSSFEKNGILCPDCKSELFDTNPSVKINEKTPVHCDCGFVGSRYL